VSAITTYHLMVLNLYDVIVNTHLMNTQSSENLFAKKVTALIRKLNIIVHDYIAHAD
jgi:hypothetical protein